MLKLDRSRIAAPDCLAKYDYRIHDWQDFKGACKKQLRFALFQLQGIEGTTTQDASEYGLRCAYCESAIYDEGHIEHFRRKNPQHFPELTFEWGNLFLACGANTHCVHYKDRPSAAAYNPNHLLKPDEHDPSSFLYFHSSGEVRANCTLNDNDKGRAQETIRVFGLNDATLRGARAKAVRSYSKMKEEDFEILALLDEAELESYFQSEVAATRWQPHATAIRHYLLNAV